ncbi:hypothetical protein Runsl_0835 [Runella slithyformis DSM 19594]|uniref:Uncharacterized protein n=1 Tax=Runella slithyformis (strain ATCC 29530 / DSM 19594 / LMG 11500 / NCIMB 11436 / LSU 4) TaxID=761193 RepID=A0A7U3ZHE6_RUNSL|nr:hypothetical protein Runsl_0835 [Runella slithyformis DSM 19594]
MGLLNLPNQVLLHRELFLLSIENERILIHSFSGRQQTLNG